MKKLILLSLIMAGIALMAGFSTPAQAQSPASNEKPTFYRLTSGTYVNGWPRFTMTYPKDWLEWHPLFQEIFRAGNPGSTPLSFFAVTPAPSASFRFDNFADALMSYFKAIAKDVTRRQRQAVPDCGTAPRPGRLRSRWSLTAYRGIGWPLGR